MPFRQPGAPAAHSISYTYDALNRLTVKSVPASPGGASAYSVYYGYDLRGLMTYARFSSTSGSGITNTYDALARMATTSTNMDGTTRTITPTYDLAGKRTALNASTGYAITYSRDALGRITSIQEPSGSTPLLALVSYNSSGLPSNVAYGPSGASSASASYDSVGRLTSLGHDLASTTYDDSLGFSYNPASQIKQNTRSNDSYAWNGHYNVTRAYTSNGLNQYTASGSATVTYDANGNLTSDGSNSYVYDDENHLVSASGAHSATLAYDPLGRLWQTVGSVTGTTDFEYDGDRILEEFNSSGAYQRVYVYGDGDSPIVWYEYSGGTIRRYLLPDERGSTVAVADDSGNAVAINRYDEYGIPQSGNGGRFQYAGQALLIDLGLFYDKARIYSPTLGRFLQTDPVGYGDGMNWYAYVGADPINWVDPSGLNRNHTNNKPPKSKGPGGSSGDGTRLNGGELDGQVRVLIVGPNPDLYSNFIGTYGYDLQGNVVYVSYNFGWANVVSFGNELRNEYGGIADQVADIPRATACSIAHGVFGNRIRIGADAAGGMGGVIAAGTGISLNDNGDIMFDKYFQIGKGGAAILGGGITADNGATSAGDHYGKPLVLAAGAGLFSASASREEGTTQYSFSGTVGGKVGVEVAKMGESWTSTTQIGSLHCRGN